VEETFPFTPDDMNQKLFDNLITLGKGLAENGKLDQIVLGVIAKPKRFPPILGPLFRAFLKTKMYQRYFDNMLEENEAFDHRNDRPFIDPV